MAKISEVFAGSYVTASDLGPTHKTAIIHSVTVDTIGRDRALKPILELVNSQGQAWPSALVLNKTNALRLAVAFGDDTDQWPGKAIELWAEPVDFNGASVPGIHVEPALNRAGALVPSKAAGGPRWDQPPGKLDDEVPF